MVERIYYIPTKMVYLFRKNCIGTRPAGNGITQVFLKATETQMKYYENILKGCGSLLNGLMR